MSTVLNNEDFLKVLNSKDKEVYSSEKYLSSDIGYDEAVQLYNASRGFREISLLSEGIKITWYRVFQTLITMQL